MKQTLRTGAVLLVLLPSLRAQTPEFTSFESAKGVVDSFLNTLPPGLASFTPAAWNAWNKANDRSIRNRLDRGDLDSMVNLLLYGTSFTGQPRIGVSQLGQMTRNGVLRERVSDLVRGLAQPRQSQRLAILRRLVLKNGLSLDTPEDREQTGVFVLDNLQRVLKEKVTFAERSRAAVNSPPEVARNGIGAADPARPILVSRAGLFRDRGVSLDTGLMPNFSIDLALQRLEARGAMHPGQVRRIGVIGPGLSFIDKDEEHAFDYFQMQTVQPFALIDSLLRLGLARRGKLQLTAFDISPRVLQHFQQMREAAQKKDAGYTIQLPQDIGRQWAPILRSYWSDLGSQIGKSVKPIAPPPLLAGLKTRAVRVRPEVVLECNAVDLDIVAQRIGLPEDRRFDLIVATNIFLYYDRFQRALAMSNIAAMLKAGGVLLTNDELPILPGDSVRISGVTSVTDGKNGRDAVVWYRKNG